MFLIWPEQFLLLLFSSFRKDIKRSGSLDTKNNSRHKIAIHCQKFGSKWRTRVRIELLMAAKSCKEVYGISTKIQNTTTKSHNIR